MLGGLCIEAVKSETANESRTGASGRADGREMGMGSVPERLERRIRLEGHAERLCTLWSNAIDRETANESQLKASTGADSRIWGVRWRT